MPSTDPTSPAAHLEAAPEIDAPNERPRSVPPNERPGPVPPDKRPHAVPWPVKALAACALATIGTVALLHGVPAGDAVLAALAVPALLGLAFVVIDFAWTPWRSAQAERRQGPDETTEPPPAFVDTQATWRQPRPTDAIAKTPITP